jgi:hypothetical protein
MSPRVGVVCQNAADRDRIPATTFQRHDAVCVQFVVDVIEAARLGVASEDAPNDLGLELLDLALAGMGWYVQP